MTNSARLSGRPSSSAAYNVGDVVDTPDSAIKSWRYLGAGEWEPNDAVRYTTGPGGVVRKSNGLAVGELGVGSVIYAQRQHDGYLPANGAVYSRAAYPALRATIGTVPDGAGTWTARTSAADNSWRAVCWSPELSLFCAVAYTGTGDRVMTNAPAATYNPSTHFKLPSLPNATSGEARAFIYAGA